MTFSVPFKTLEFGFANYRTYFFSLVFVAGNILLPQLCHLVPQGGLIFLPIYFFTLIAAYKFGLKVGLLTAVLSPVVNSLLFGMPVLAMLPVLLIKSSLLAIIAAWVSKNAHLSLLSVAFVVIAYQFAGGLAELIITVSFSAAVQDFVVGFPGMLIQIFLGWFVLRLLAKYEF
ncbi:MAG: ECF transporter S component [Culturomica sp.]|jgi:hypothetical protein|nr:ECF transporter S component [Culturomica sp.]